MEKLKLVAVVTLVVILVLMLGSANKLKTPRTISLSGDVTGSTNFDGSGNVTIPASIKKSTTQTTVVNTTKNGTEFKLTFKRNMNVVYIKVGIIVPSGKEADSGILNFDELMPEWAKTNGNTVETLAQTSFIEGIRVGENASIESYYKASLQYSPSMSVKHRLSYSYMRENFSDSGGTNLTLQYII